MKNLLKQKETASLLIVIAVFLIVSLFNPNFLSFKNIFQTINGSSVYVLVALGMSFAMFTGEVDVSVGATLGFSAAIAGQMIVAGYSIPVVALCCILFGIMVGLINAIGIIFFKIPSIIMTLGTNGIIRGGIYVYTQGKWIENLPINFKNLAQYKFFDSFTMVFLGCLIIAIALYFFTQLTMIGKSFKAVGDNIDGAKLIGISVSRTKTMAFVLCAVFASLGGIFYASRVGFVTPTAGVGYEMTAIAACVIGGINLNGGEGTPIGSLIGAILMASISRVLVFLGFPSTFDNTITGMILIVIVVIGAVMNRRTTEKLRKARLAAKLLE